MKEQQKNKIILHACCAICSGYPVTFLKDAGYEPVVFFYNPNIYPKSEYEKRLETERILCGALDCELIEGDYEPEVIYLASNGLESEPEKGKL